MNGAQDLGGMMGFGPVVPEPGEPVFHAAWERRVLGLTLAWGLTGQKTSGSSFEHELTYLNLVATRELSPGWTAHGNVGWLRSESAGNDTTTWNLAIERALGNGVDVMGELYGDDRTKPWLGAGVRWAASDKLSLNASVAVQNDTPKQRLWTVG